MRGASTPGFWKRHRIAAVALVFSAAMTVALIATDVTRLGYDAAGIAINALLFMAIGFPVAWALLTADMKLVGWWRRRHPIPSQTYPGPVVGAAEASAFRWSGRTTRHAWGMVAFMAFFILLSGVMLSDQGPGTPMGNLTLAIMLLMLIILLAAFAFAYRRKTFVIDASGIHVERGLRSDIHARWGDLREIGVAKFPFAEWAAPFSLEGLPKMILLRGQEGGLLGVIQPAGEAPREIAPQIEMAIRAHAEAHGVPVRDVGARETMAWRRTKKPSAAPRGAP